MINNILHEIQREIETSNELNELIKEFKEVVENFIHNLEYFEEMYKLGDHSAKTVAFLKNFAEHINAVNVEYQQLIDAQAGSRKAEQKHLSQLSQKFDRNMDKQFTKLNENMQKRFSNLEKNIQIKIDSELENIHHTLEKNSEAILQQLGVISFDLKCFREENAKINVLPHNIPNAPPPTTSARNNVESANMNFHAQWGELPETQDTPNYDEDDEELPF